jgi:hypothetical protein
MSMASIAPRPIPLATVAAAAAVAVLALGSVVVAQGSDSSSSTPGQHASNVDQFRKHAGRVHPLEHPQTGERDAVRSTHGRSLLP